VTSLQFVNVFYTHKAVILCSADLLYSMWYVGPRYHGMARPQVADGGTASDVEVSCEYIE